MSFNKKQYYLIKNQHIKPIRYHLGLIYGNKKAMKIRKKIDKLLVKLDKELNQK